MQSLFGVWLAPIIGLRILISKKITTGSKKTMDFNLTQVLLISLKSITIYVFIVFAIRLFGKKELAQLSVVDLVFILLISNSVQNAMVGPDTSLIGGMAAASGLFVINYVFKWLLRRFPKFSNAVQGHSLLLIYQGKVLEHNLEESMLSLEELRSAVREHGVETIAEVDLAVLEVDGNISVMSKDYADKTTRMRKGRKSIAKNA